MRYCRVMSAGEKLAIETVGKLDLNRDDWQIYRPRTVVFLFDLSVADAERIRSAANYNCETNGETWILHFSANLTTEADRSQGGWTGAVIHKQPIPVSVMGDIEWIKHVPPPRRF